MKLLVHVAELLCEAGL
ncbi:MAG: hypothetical protein ACLUD0_17475 [Eubacterium ramulus]